MHIMKNSFDDSVLSTLYLKDRLLVNIIVSFVANVSSSVRHFFSTGSI